MLLDPGEWLAQLMQLTPMPVDFKMFILVLAIGGFICAWVVERHVFPDLARLIGQLFARIWPHRRKKRKEYKLVLAEMKM